MAKAVWTDSQVINQLDSGLHWSGSNLTYGFPTTASWFPYSEKNTFSALNSSQQTTATLSIKLWDDLMAPDFSLAANGATATIKYSNTTTDIGYAHAYFPGGWSGAGSVWFNSNYGAGSGTNNLMSPTVGNWGFLTFVHETGHALGLDHPGEYNGGSPTYANDALYAQDSHMYTVMSYFTANNTGADWYASDGRWYYPQTPMLHDVMAIQAMYGVETSTRTGNTTYGFNATADSWLYDFTQNRHPVLTIFDSGGVDTLDLSGWSYSCTIDLTPGSFSNCDMMTYNISIAHTAWIENGIGGGGADVLNGNAVANVLTGLAGNDTISGLAGNDSLYGGDGNDTLTGGAGDDFIDGGAGTDSCSFSAAYTYYTASWDAATSCYIVVDTRSGSPDGTDRVKNVESYVFSNATIAVANLLAMLGNEIQGTSGADALTGTPNTDRIYGQDGNDQLFGLAGNDFIDGGAGADLIQGGTGADTLTGGLGADTFVFADGDTGLALAARDVITDFVAGTDKLDLSAMDANTLVAGDQGFRFLGSSPNSTYDGQAGALVFSWVASRNMTVVHGDINGDGKPDFAIELVGNIALTSADFAGGSLAAPPSLTGDGSANTLYGTVSNDLMQGFGGDDTLYGYGGNDTLDGGTGADTMIGGLGDDVYVVDDVGDVVIENPDEGVDTVRARISYALGANVEGLVLQAGVGAIDGTGNAANNVITGNEAGNIIIGGTGADTLTGDLGADTFVFAEGDTGLALAARDVITDFVAGTDKLDLSAMDANTLVAGDQGFRFLGSSPNSTYDGQAGALVFTWVASRNMTVVHGDINGDGKPDFALELVGNIALTSADFAGSSLAAPPSLTGDGSANTLQGTPSDDLMQGFGGDDTLYGYGGNDTLDGGTGADTMIGGLGDDVYVVDDVGDVVSENANEGTDTVRARISYALGANVESLVLQAGVGAINGTGNAANNVITGNEAGNIIIGGTGADTLTGDLGADTFVFAEGDTGLALAARDVITDFVAGTDKLDLSAMDANTLVAGDQGFRFLGSSPNSTYDGQAGALVYTWVASRNMTVVHGDANGDGVPDFALELVGNIALTSADFAGSSLAAPPSLTGDGSANTLQGTPSDDLMQGFGGDDTLYGYGGNDTLDGGTGADTMIGGLGDDVYVVDDAGDVVSENANEGTDTVRATIGYTLGANVENLVLQAGAGAIDGSGNAANNTITGNDSNNIIRGRVGADTLTGGLGADTFVYADGDVGVALAARDVITDFVAGTDQLDLSAMDANTLIAGDQGFRFLGSSPNSTYDGQAGALVYTWVASRNMTVVHGDTNGDGYADFAIDLVGNIALSANDFLL